MRVLVHADAAGHAIPGGVGGYVRRLLEAFTEEPHGHEIVPLTRGRLPLLPMYALWNYLRLPPVKQRADVVHATNLVVPPARRAKLVSTVHDLGIEVLPEVVPQPWRALYLRGLRRSVAEADVLIAVSQATKDALLDLHAVDGERVVVTPLAPNVTTETARDESVLSRLRIAEPYVFSVGTVEPRKNHARLVRAFAAIASEVPDHRLVIAGMSGWGQDAVDEAISETRIGGRVVLAGGVSDSEMASLYAHADAFAFPSLYEGFGIPVVEAMGFGLPTVVGDTPSLVEVGGDAVVASEPTDVDALAAGLRTVLTDGATRERLVAAARRRASEFSWAETARLTVLAYERAAS